MLLHTFTYTISTIIIIGALQFPSNINSDASLDDGSMNKDQNKSTDQSGQDASNEEGEVDNEETKRRVILNEVLETLDPIGNMMKVTEHFSDRLENLSKSTVSLKLFMEKMDNLTSEACIVSQKALWSYVTDVNNEFKRKDMVLIANKEEEIKNKYWLLLKNKYSIQRFLNDSKIGRKLRIIRERAYNIQIPQSKGNVKVDDIQLIWNKAAVCPYDSKNCQSEKSKTVNDIMAVFKYSNNSKELQYYWKSYRDVTGKKVRPLFRDIVLKMNALADSDNFSDIGEMWRYMYEDKDLVGTVDRIWREIKPLYDNIHTYVKEKLKVKYKDEFKNNEKYIPAHILGNVWAQEWQAIYPLVAPHPSFQQPKLTEIDHISSISLLDTIDKFYVSLGFESSKESYQDLIQDNNSITSNCLPSSHDMCDGINYKIKWCGEKVTDVTVSLLRAARLLGHIQYFKSYRSLPLLFRDGPTPAFHEALSDVVAIQVITPTNMKILKLNSMKNSKEKIMNHLTWLALEKIPSMAFGYILDKWRWNVFSNLSKTNWNAYWWTLRENETGITPPVPRDESDLDPASKYHILSHIQYITYLISNVITFQILLSMCKAANHTGPLHECSLYGDKEAGVLLKNGMTLGASKDWRKVLQVMTGESELSTKGILEYFSPLKEYIREQYPQINDTPEEYVDDNAVVIFGLVVFFLITAIVILYLIRRYNLFDKVCSVCSFSKSGSLDIVTNEMPTDTIDEIDGVAEDKV